MKGLDIALSWIILILTVDANYDKSKHRTLDLDYAKPAPATDNWRKNEKTPRFRTSETMRKWPPSSVETTSNADAEQITKKTDGRTWEHVGQDGAPSWRKQSASEAARASPSSSRAANANDVRRANEHYLKVRSEARCRNPRPRVVRVLDVYPDASREYLPRCTVLHRCGDDTGCCDSETMQCVAKAMQVVELHFYNLRMTGTGAVIPSGGNHIVKLTFVNHTECECQPSSSSRTRSAVPVPKCGECPGKFWPRELPNGGCVCDCFDKQKACLRVKRGREPLPDTARRCVEAAHCQQPECEYGPYDVTVGRCPKKHERNKHQNAMASSHHHFRLDERD